MSIQFAVKVAAIAALAAPFLSAGAAEDPSLVHARKLLKESILIDGHNDLPWAVRGAANSDPAAYDIRKTVSGQTDLPRLRAGGVGGQFWSVYVPATGSGGFAVTQLEQIDLAKRIIAQYSKDLEFATTAAQVRAAFRKGRIASMLGMEGGHAIENSLGALREFYELGVRYMTLTHSKHIDWADSATDGPPRHGGLTPFGEEVVREMNRLGMLVDLSHVSADTMDDALRVSQAPVIFSHSSARALCDVPRDVPDDILRRIPANGGVVMVTFLSEYVDQDVANVIMPAGDEYDRRTKGVDDPEKRKAIREEIYGNLKIPTTTVAKVADHIEHIRKVAGVEHIGLGGDFDGASRFPVGLSDVSMYPNLFAELIRRGWSDHDLKLLAGENVLRVMEQAEAVAAKLQKTTRPSVMRFSATP